MPSLADIATFQGAIHDLNILAIADLVSLWGHVGDQKPDAVQSALVAAVPAVIAPYIGASGDLAAQWYDDLAPESSFTATPAALPPVDQLEASVRWAVGPLYGRGEAPVLDLLGGSMQRYVFGGARDTIVTNAHREGVRWARQASASACAFCRMLASRGAVYGSAAKAMASHDNCRCAAVPLRKGDTYTPPSYVADWEAQYIDARNSTDGSTKEILAAMRADQT